MGECFFFLSFTDVALGRYSYPLIVVKVKIGLKPSISNFLDYELSVSPYKFSSFLEEANLDDMELTFRPSWSTCACSFIFSLSDFNSTNGGFMTLLLSELI